MDTFLKGGVETGEMINKHNGWHQPAKNRADKVWRCWTLIFAAKVLDDNSFCSFQDLMWIHLFVILIFLREGEWEGEVGGERDRQFYPRFNAAPCHSVIQAFGDLGTSVRRINRRTLNRRPSWKDEKLQKRTKQGIYGNVLIVWNKWPFILAVSRCR